MAIRQFCSFAKGGVNGIDSMERNDELGERPPAWTNFESYCNSINPSFEFDTPLTGRCQT